MPPAQEWSRLQLCRLAGDVNITAIKALPLDFQFDGCLIKIETDAGRTSHGETGTNAALHHVSQVPLLTGEKLELLRQFKPFLDSQAVDIIHPDISFAGGLTGVRRIAAYAALTRTPVALHNVGTLVRTYAPAACPSMPTGDAPAVKAGIFRVPNKPGLGLEPDDAFLRLHMARGEQSWA